jgi:hypothetical protein
MDSNGTGWPSSGTLSNSSLNVPWKPVPTTLNSQPPVTFFISSEASDENPGVANRSSVWRYIVKWLFKQCSHIILIAQDDVVGKANTKKIALTDVDVQTQHHAFNVMLLSSKIELVYECFLLMIPWCGGNRSSLHLLKSTVELRCVTSRASRGELSGR